MLLVLSLCRATPAPPRVVFRSAPDLASESQFVSVRSFVGRSVRKLSSDERPCHQCQLKIVVVVAMASLTSAYPVASTSRLVFAGAQSHLPRHLPLPPLARSSSTTTASTTSSTTTSAGSTSANAPRRASSRRLSARPGANLVGPADPVSNLRPVVYGSAFQTFLDSNDQTNNSSTGSTSSGSPSSSITTRHAALSHPYSTSEFTSLSPTSSSSSSSRGPRSVPPRSEYQTSLLRRLEAAELAHHLRRARADRFSQDFWEDNNRRYTKALEEYRRSRSGGGAGDWSSGSSTSSSSGSGSSIASSPGSASRTTPGGTERAPASQPLAPPPSKPPRASEDLLSPFYSAWLSANAARHQAYNERLWRITREDLVPAAQYSLLRTWCAVVAWGEARLGRIIGAGGGAGRRSGRDKEGW